MQKITLADGRELVAGSFRGVPFRTVEADLRIGRRTVSHEFPERDAPYVEDLGRRARQVVVEAYVIGANYLAERNALIAAIEAPGPGELSHPRYGLLNVAVGDYVSVKESPREGGMARFSITFIEAGSNIFPTALENTVDKLDASCDDVEQAAQDEFADEFSVEGAGVLAEQSITGVTSRLKALLSQARRFADVSALGDMVRDIAALSKTVASLIRLPVVLVQSLRSLQAQLIQALRLPLQALAELQSVFASNARSPSYAPIALSTPARSLRNANALADLTRRLCLAQQARVLAVALSDVTLVRTADQALVLRNALLAQVDVELEHNDPPAALARALTQMRAAVVRDVAVRAEFLQRSSRYTPATVLPALVLAHRIYHDATRADELVLRNNVRHPAFVPAAPMEVLQ